MSYEGFAARLRESGIIGDPWVDGAPRFREEPMVIPHAEARRLALAAEDLGLLYNELVGRVIDAGESALDFFQLTPWQRAMFAMGGPLWHGIARADLFRTPEGLVTTELNSDTPTGEAEACVLGELVDPDGQRDPNRGLSGAFVATIDTYRARFLNEDAPKTVGLVYPTEFVEDLSLVRIYKQWLEAAGYDVVLGSPFNLERGPGGGVELLGSPVSVILRHYKTDYWGERETAFDDDDGLEDMAPLDAELRVLAAAQLERRAVVVNPFSTVVTQNKRAMAYFWERIHAFSPRAQGIIRRLVPPTFRLETQDHASLREDKDGWVLKSAYGAEGDEVIVGKLSSPELFRESLAHARPGRWIAQRYFEAEREPDGLVVNYGVFLCSGRASGLYLRADHGRTDDHALSVPVLVGRSPRDS